MWYSKDSTERLMGYEDQCGWSKIRKRELARLWVGPPLLFYVGALIFSGVCER